MVLPKNGPDCYPVVTKINEVWMTIIVPVECNGATVYLFISLFE